MKNPKSQAWPLLLGLAAAAAALAMGIGAQVYFDQHWSTYSVAAPI